MMSSFTPDQIAKLDAFLIAQASEIKLRALTNYREAGDANSRRQVYHEVFSMIDHFELEVLAIRGGPSLTDKISKLEFISRLMLSSIPFIVVLGLNGDWKLG